MKTIFTFLLLFLFASLTYAKEVNLYDQPKADAKVVATVDLAAGIIPIFTPKNSDWIKVADPKNGNVGWMKSSDMNNGSVSQSTVTITQSDGKNPATYQVIQLGQPQTLTPEQQAMAKKIQAQQEAIYQSLQKSMQNMINAFKDFPVLMPVIVSPKDSTKPVKK
jgi:hypothetical protein